MMDADLDEFERNLAALAGPAEAPAPAPAAAPSAPIAEDVASSKASIASVSPAPQRTPQVHPSRILLVNSSTTTGAGERPAMMMPAALALRRPAAAAPVRPTGSFPLVAGVGITASRPVIAVGPTRPAVSTSIGSVSVGPAPVGSSAAAVAGPQPAPAVVASTPVASAASAASVVSVASAADAAAPRVHLRAVAGDVWVDPLLDEWPDNDYRIMVTNLGNDANDALLYATFKHYPSVGKVRVVRDKQTNKARGYGFVSFLAPLEMARALREMDGKHCGSRPMNLKRCDQTRRDFKAGAYGEDADAAAARLARKARAYSGGAPAGGEKRTRPAKGGSLASLYQ